MLHSNTRPFLVLRGGTSTTMKNTAHATASAASAASALLDFDRAALRVEAFGAYAIIAALVMSTAVGVLNEYDADANSFKGGRKSVTYWLAVIGAISLGVSVLSGAMTTLIFALIELYLKTALGMGKDAAYLAYLSKTGPHRRAAFSTFLGCIVTFSVGFIIDLSLRLRSNPPLLSTMMVCCVIGCISIARRLNEIMRLATQLIFTS